MSDPKTTTAPSWSSGLPEPKSTPNKFSPETIAEYIKSGSAEIGKDYIVVDVRRTDFEDYAIPGAINLPAHSFYATREGVVALLKNVRTVVFHCQSCGKSTSRGRQVAAYYQDTLEELGITTSEAFYLEGGIKGWIEKYKEDQTLVIKL